MITFLPQWLKDYKKNKLNLRLKKIVIVFMVFDILIGYTLFSLSRSENAMNIKINDFFVRKQTSNLSESKKNDGTYNTLKIALNQTLPSFNFEALNVHNNEAEITMNFVNINVLQGLISKIEKGNIFKINSVVPFSDPHNLFKYKIGVEAVK